MHDIPGLAGGDGRLERLAQPAAGSANLPVFVEWKDAEDRFYIRDGRDISTVRVVRLNVSPTGKEARVARLDEEVILR